MVWKRSLCHSVVCTLKCRVGLRTIYIRWIYGISWQGNYQIYGHIQCKYTVMANLLKWHDAYNNVKETQLVPYAHMTWCISKCYKNTARATASFVRSYVGLTRTIYTRCIYGIRAGKLPNIRSYTVYIYGYGQPYSYDLIHITMWRKHSSCHTLIWHDAYQNGKETQLVPSRLYAHMLTWHDAYDNGKESRLVTSC